MLCATAYGAQKYSDTTISMRIVGQVMVIDLIASLCEVAIEIFLYGF